MTNSVCVLGAGSTRYGKLNESIIEIALNAPKGAIDSAGITQKKFKQDIFRMFLELLINKYIWHRF